MVSISAGVTPQDGASEQRLAPEGDEPFGVKILGVQGPEPHGGGSDWKGSNAQLQLRREAQSTACCDSASCLIDPGAHLQRLTRDSPQHAGKH